MRLGYIASLSTALVRKVIPQLRERALDRVVVGGLVPPSRTFDRERETLCDLRARIPLQGTARREERERAQVREAHAQLAETFPRFLYVHDVTGYGGKTRSGVRGVEMPYSHTPAARIDKDLLFASDVPHRRLRPGDGLEHEFSRAVGSYGVRAVFLPSEAPAEVYTRRAGKQSASTAKRLLEPGKPYDVSAGVHLFQGAIVDDESIRHGGRIVPSFFVLEGNGDKKAVTMYRFKF
jgi:hypothetical protein